MEEREIELMSSLAAQQRDEVSGLRKEIGLYGLKTVPRLVCVHF